ncbi:MAG: hypothetical protein A2V88_04395 [Elusimicrobia bacterium RBG_16_66_12]|nr:MAG: hypothetical protein A2V88_04395 [Elusimicrobia bacterium RBG_16_66_12]
MSELPPINWPTRNAAEFVEVVQDYYVRKPGNATPRKLMPLLAFLDELADQADDAAPELTDVGIRVTIKGWRERSSSYRAQLAAAHAIDPDDGRPIAAGVIGPLLLGWYEDRPQQSTLDAVTPIQAAHMAEAATEAMADAWARLGDDLASAAKDTAKGPAEAASALADAIAWLADPDHRWRLALLPAGLAGVAGIGIGIAVAVRRATA